VSAELTIKWSVLRVTVSSLLVTALNAVCILVATLSIVVTPDVKLIHVTLTSAQFKLLILKLPSLIAVQVATTLVAVLLPVINAGVYQSNEA
jgi:hypothetical protein